MNTETIAFVATAILGVISIFATVFLKKIKDAISFMADNVTVAVEDVLSIPKLVKDAIADNKITPEEATSIVNAINEAAGQLKDLFFKKEVPEDNVPKKETVPGIGV